MLPTIGRVFIYDCKTTLSLSSRVEDRLEFESMNSQQCQLQNCRFKPGFVFQFQGKVSRQHYHLNPVFWLQVRIWHDFRQRWGIILVFQGEVSVLNWGSKLGVRVLNLDFKPGFPFQTRVSVSSQEWNFKREHSK